MCTKKWQGLSWGPHPVCNEATMLQQMMTPPAGHRDGETGFEYLIVTVTPGESVSEARRALVEHSEHGRWELARTCIYQGGLRRYWMRRKVMRVSSSLRGPRPSPRSQP